MSDGKNYHVVPYDLKREIYQQSLPFGYHMDKSMYVSSSDCSQFIPGIGNRKVHSRGLPPANVDAESYLKNKYEILNSCDNGLQKPGAGQAAASGSSEYFPKDCKNELIPINTRLDYQKPCNLPGAFINRFDPQIADFQNISRIRTNRAVGINSRNYARDQYSEKKMNAANGRCKY